MCSLLLPALLLLPSKPLLLLPASESPSPSEPALEEVSDRNRTPLAEADAAEGFRPMASLSWPGKATARGGLCGGVIGPAGSASLAAGEAAAEASSSAGEGSSCTDATEETAEKSSGAPVRMLGSDPLLTTGTAARGAKGDGRSSGGSGVAAASASGSVRMSAGEADPAAGTAAAVSAFKEPSTGAAAASASESSPMVLLAAELDVEDRFKAELALVLALPGAPPCSAMAGKLTGRGRWWPALEASSRSGSRGCATTAFSNGWSLLMRPPSGPRSSKMLWGANMAAMRMTVVVPKHASCRSTAEWMPCLCLCTVTSATAGCVGRHPRTKLPDSPR
mmetsp:Transcript_15248/g.46041  ORF Transcript_15248/g.46041 Transcript_15248/m.46041 type:complete len:335 (-) Transcript_15248:3306-4310(-)